MDSLTLILSATILLTAGFWILLTRIVVKHKNPKSKVNYNTPEEDPEFY